MRKTVGSRMRENRKLVSVSAYRNEVAEVVGRQPDPESRVSALGVKIAGVTMGGDGDLASNNSVRREMRHTGSCE